MYLRTSSATNLDGDSEERQKESIRKYADSQGMEIVQGAYDQAVKGSDSIHEREGFSVLIQYCLDNDVTTILCENASRFARDVIVQEMGYRELKKLKIQLIPVDAPDYFTGINCIFSFLSSLYPISCTITSLAKRDAFSQRIVVTSLSRQYWINTENPSRSWIESEPLTA
jgi:hypothetical protein